MAKSKSNKSNFNKDALLAAIIALILGLAGGYAIAEVASNNDSETKNDSSMMESTSHSHGMFEVSEEEAPTVDFMVEEDAKSGWNIRIITTNFEFTPEKVNGENVVGEGHAHLYVDGEKVARVYSDYFHYNGNFDGTKTFRVTLNANDHSEYVVNDEVIEIEKEVSHDHSTMPHGSEEMKDESHIDSDHMDMDN